jgi:hypothetical protein
MCCFGLASGLSLVFEELDFIARLGVGFWAHGIS